MKILKFHSDTCCACQSLCKKLDEIVKKHPGIELEEVDCTCYVQGVLVESSKRMQETDVWTLPTLVLYKDGKEVDRVVGNVPIEIVEEKINKYL